MKKIILVLLSFMTMTYFSFAEGDGAKVDFKKINLSEAMKLADESGKMIFCNFSTSWCGPCKTQFKEVYSDEEVGRFMNDKFISLYIDAEAAEWKDIARKYKISGYPTMLILDSEGDVEFTLTGAKKKDVFIEEINRFLSPERSPEALKERYENGERTPQLISDYAVHLLQNGHDKEGEEIVNAYYNSLSDIQKVSKENWFLFEKFLLSNDDIKMKYMLENYSSFVGNIDKNVLDSHAEKCIRVQLMPYISGYLIKNNEYSPVEMRETKKILDNIKLEDKKELYALYNMSKARINGDLGKDKGYNKFMKVVSQEAVNLNSKTYGVVLMNLGFLETSGSNVAKKTAQKLLDSYRLKYKSEITPMEQIFFKQLERSFVNL